ncbi:Card1-like endonuclease domain-containing protein [Yunchengibacter salinarum]|uniref:Card1-like endonuclease domain-containing protein n=1 Tax=Yunchengibacter salinarum TaxID=3133399 RepID=UPI0035B5F31E
MTAAHYRPRAADGHGGHIRHLLARRGTRLEGSHTAPWAARQRLPVSRLLGDQYDRFDVVRRLLMSDWRRGVIMAILNPQCTALVQTLSDSGLLTLRGGRAMASTAQARRYLSGGWLEELCWGSLLEAGADDALCSALVTPYSGGGQRNELDVVAAWRGRLLFVSCKAFRIYAHHYRPGRMPLDHAVATLSEKRTRYGAAHDRALLLNTLDFWVDKKLRPRIRPADRLARRAGISLLGFEGLTPQTLPDRLGAVLRGSGTGGIIPTRDRQPGAWLR